MLQRLEFGDRRPISDDLRETVRARTGVALKPPNFWLDAWATGQASITAGGLFGTYGKHSVARVALIGRHVGLFDAAVSPVGLRRGLSGRVDDRTFGLWCPGFSRPYKERLIFITMDDGRWVLRNSTRICFEIDDTEGRPVYRRSYEGRRPVREVDDDLPARQAAVLLLVGMTPSIYMVPTARQIWGLG